MRSFSLGSVKRKTPREHYRQIEPSGCGQAGQLRWGAVEDVGVAVEVGSGNPRRALQEGGLNPNSEIWNRPRPRARPRCIGIP